MVTAGLERPARISLGAGILYVTATAYRIRNGDTPLTEDDLGDLLVQAWRQGEDADGLPVWVPLSAAIADLVERELLTPAPGGGYIPTLPPTELRLDDPSQEHR